MTLQIVRFTTTEDHVPDVEAALTTAVEALAAVDPPGVRYAATRLADGVTFLLLLDLDEGVENPLPSIPAARALQQQMPVWAGGPVAPQPLTLLAAHRLLEPAS